MTRIFVYGTLKRGHRSNHYLAGQKFLGEARSVPGYPLYSMGDYPSMVRSADATHDVSGEVWEVDAVCLGRLNDLEGLPEGLYERVPLRLAAPFSDQPADTYLYLGSVAGWPVIGSEWL